jgi:hypothetical protein
MDNFKIMDVLVYIEWDSLDIEVTGDSLDSRSLIPARARIILFAITPGLTSRRVQCPVQWVRSPLLLANSSHRMKLIHEWANLSLHLV